MNDVKNSRIVNNHDLLFNYWISFHNSLYGKTIIIPISHKKKIELHVNPLRDLILFNENLIKTDIIYSIWKIMKYGKIYEIKNKGLPYFNDNDELVFGSLFVCVRTNRKELASLNGMLTKIFYDQPSKQHTIDFLTSFMK